MRPFEGGARRVDQYGHQRQDERVRTVPTRQNRSRSEHRDHRGAKPEAAPHSRRVGRQPASSTSAIASSKSEELLAGRRLEPLRQVVLFVAERVCRRISRAIRGRTTRHSVLVQYSDDSAHSEFRRTPLHARRIHNEPREKVPQTSTAWRRLTCRMTGASSRSESAPALGRLDDHHFRTAPRPTGQ